MKPNRFALLGWMTVAASSQAAFVPGNLVVLSVAANGNAATQAITLKEFAYNGNGSFNLAPTNYAVNSSVITLPGASDHEGVLHQSVDGSVLTFGGYGVGTGSSGVVASTSVPRLIGSINSSFALSTTATTAYSGLAIRSVTSTDGAHFWTGGNAGKAANNNLASGGQFYVDAGGTTQITSVDARSNSIVKNQLWGTNSGDGGFTTGSGLPTSAATNTVRMQYPAAPNNAWVKSDAIFLDLDGNGINDTAYTTDGKNYIGKWHSDDGTAWAINGQYQGNKTPTSGTIFNDTNQLAAYVYGGSVQLLLVNQAGNLYQLTDTNGITNGFTSDFLANVTPAPIYTASDGSSFRGLVVLAPEPTGLALLGLALPALARRRK